MWEPIGGSRIAEAFQQASEAMVTKHMGEFADDPRLLANVAKHGPMSFFPLYRLVPSILTSSSVASDFQ
jgi:hypothetical protein